MPPRASVPPQTPEEAWQSALLRAAQQGMEDIALTGAAEVLFVRAKRASAASAWFDALADAAWARGFCVARVSVLADRCFDTLDGLVRNLGGTTRPRTIGKADWAYQAGGFALPDGAMDLPAPYPPTAAPKAVPAPAVKANRDPQQSKKLVILAGRIHTAAGPAIEKGAILVVNGKIATVVKGGDLQIPADATVLTAAEVTPGLIDPFTTAGLSGAYNLPADQDQDERSDPTQSDLRALDGFNPREPLLDQYCITGFAVRSSKLKVGMIHVPHWRRSGSKPPTSSRGRCGSRSFPSGVRRTATTRTCGMRWPTGRSSGGRRRCWVSCRSRRRPTNSAGGGRRAARPGR